MLGATVEKVYVVRKGSKRIVVELCRTGDGRLFVVPILAEKHVYKVEEGEEKEWSYDTSKAEEVDYMSLPQNIREALSRLRVI